MTENAKIQQAAQRASGLFGSLKDALAAASREEQRPSAEASKPVSPGPAPVQVAGALPAPAAAPSKPEAAAARSSPAPVAALDASAKMQPTPSAEEAARAVRGSLALKPQERHVELADPPTTRVVRKPEASQPATDEAPRTQLVRGRQKLVRNDFAQDPVVAWLVVVGGPGLGSYRPVFEGNNTIGRARSQRIAIDFGDEAISSEEQAYIRYDSTDRSFLFVPNLAKTNVVSVNDKRPTGAVELAHMDVITVGRTQLVFVPFCGPDFDWAELAEVKD